MSTSVCPTWTSSCLPPLLGSLSPWMSPQKPNCWSQKCRRYSWLLSPSLLASSLLVCPAELPLWTAPHVSPVLDFPLHMCSLQIPLINAKRQKQCQCPSADEWMNTMCQIHTTEYYSSMKKEKSAGTCFNTDGPWKHYAKWTKSDAKGHILHIP